MEKIFLYSFYTIFEFVLYPFSPIICSHHYSIHEFSFHTWSTVKIFLIEKNTIHKNAFDKVSNNNNNKNGRKDKTNRIARKTAGKVHKQID